MTAQRDAAIQEQTDQAQHHRDQAVACEVAVDLICSLDAPSESVRAILVAAAHEIDDRQAAHLATADHHAARANVLRAHAQASAKGAPYRPVERLARLTAVRVRRYDEQGEGSG